MYTQPTNWEINAARWAGLTSPWRPSLGDIENYQKICQDKFSGQILVLGATPELRDLIAFEQPSGAPKPIVADGSTTMLDRMTELCLAAKPSNEQWIISDWCHIKFLPKSLDLVLGDVFWQLLSLAEQTRLRDILAHALKSDGKLVSRFRFRALQRLTDRPEDVIRYYLQAFDRSPTNAAVLRDSMAAHLGDIFVDAKTKQINRYRIVNAIASAMRYHTALRHQRFLRQAKTAAISMTNRTSQTREEVLAVLEKKFFKLNEATATDYLAADDVILALVKHDKTC